MKTEQTDRALIQAATEARQLAKNQLLAQVLTQRKADIIQQWQLSESAEKREEAWQALKQTEILAGAITDEIKRAIERDPRG